MRTIAPTRHKRVDVAPILPGYNPKNNFEKEYPASDRAFSTRPVSVRADTASGVAPLKMSTAAYFKCGMTVQTVSPDRFPGYAKNRNALPVNAGFKKFLPVPPKISLPMTTPKEMPMAACQRGIVGGRVKGKSMAVTKTPSLISCFLMVANRISQPNPTR